MLPLAERRLVSVYGPFLVGRLLDGTGPVEVRATRVDFEQVAQDGDTAEVVPSDLELDVVDAQGHGTSLMTDGTCLTTTRADGGSSHCTTDLPLLASLGLSQLRLTTVREDGGWYVSILGTVGTVTDGLMARLVRLVQDGRFSDPAWLASQVTKPAE